jgi:hypothetical protein
MKEQGLHGGHWRGALEGQRAICLAVDAWSSQPTTHSFPPRLTRRGRRSACWQCCSSWRLCWAASFPGRAPLRCHLGKDGEQACMLQGCASLCAVAKPLWATPWAVAHALAGTSGHILRPHPQATSSGHILRPHPHATQAAGILRSSSKQSRNPCLRHTCAYALLPAAGYPARLLACSSSWSLTPSHLFLHFSFRRPCRTLFRRLCQLSSAPWAGTCSHG